MIFSEQPPTEPGIYWVKNERQPNFGAYMVEVCGKSPFLTVHFVCSNPHQTGGLVDASRIVLWGSRVFGANDEPHITDIPHDLISGKVFHAWQSRVITELFDLREKQDKLMQFISSNPQFKDLPDAEQRRMCKQMWAMLQYSEVLAERIAAFKTVES